jgi:hypothetical protein
MIVDEQLAAAREAREREHLPGVAARDDARAVHDAVVVDRPDEAHLASTRQPDRGAHRIRRL